LTQLNNSFVHDQFLWKEDIQGSLGYAKELFDIEILSEEEYILIKGGLEAIFDEISSDEEGVLQDGIEQQDEDIHSFIERKLVEKVSSLFKIRMIFLAICKIGWKYWIKSSYRKI